MDLTWGEYSPICKCEDEFLNKIPNSVPSTLQKDTDVDTMALLSIKQHNTTLNYYNV